MWDMAIKPCDMTLAVPKGYGFFIIFPQQIMENSVFWNMKNGGLHHKLSTMARAAVSAMAQVVQTHPQALRIGAFVASRSQARLRESVVPGARWCFRPRNC